MTTAKRLFGALAFFGVSACASPGEPAPGPTTEPLRVGAETLLATDYELIRGKSVGLVTNQSAVVGEKHLIDMLNEAPNVKLVALFGPEHGLRGDAEAGASITDATDAQTGVPIFSLYGAVNRPSQESLADVEVLLFDIQDVGARFYTYISTMGRAMQSAAEAGIPFVVLDRPNPLGGERVDGYVRDSTHVSGVGLYPIPVQHGLTVGELALMIKGESFLSGLEGLELQVVTMAGWRRNMLWPDTGLEWIPTSPNIRTFETALVYAGTCFIEGTSLSEGRGTESPFLAIGAPWLNAGRAILELSNAGLSGISFTAGEAVPRSIPGVAEDPKFNGQPIQTVRLRLTDPDLFAPLKTGVMLLSVLYEASPSDERDTLLDERWLGLLAGTDRLFDAVASGTAPNDIVGSWQEEVEAFRELRQKYLLYD